LGVVLRVVRPAAAAAAAGGRPAGWGHPDR